MAHVVAHRSHVRSLGASGFNYDCEQTTHMDTTPLCPVGVACSQHAPYLLNLLDLSCADTSICRPCPPVVVHDTHQSQMDTKPYSPLSTDHAQHTPHATV